MPCSLQRRHVLGVVAAGQDAGVERRGAASSRGRPAARPAPVSSSTRVERDAGLVQAAAVPDVEISSTPSSCSPCANVESPFLSVTEIRAPLDLHTGSFTRTRRPSTWMRLAANSRTASGSSRCSISWMRASSTPGRRHHTKPPAASCSTIGPESPRRVGVDQVHGHAGDPDAVASASAIAVRAGKGGQQRRVHVEDPPGEPVDETRREDPHVARQHDQLDAVRAPGTRRSSVLVGGDERRDRGPLGALQPGRVRPGSRPRRRPRCRAASISACRFVPIPRSARRPSAQHHPGALDQLAGDPAAGSRRARAPAAPARPTSARHHRDVADAEVEHAPHLVLLDAERREPAEHRRPLHELAGRSRTPTPSGNWRARLPGMPPPVMCAIAAHVDRAGQLAHRPRRRSGSARAARRRPRRRRARPGCRPASTPAALEQLADQREAVGVRAAGGQRDDRVAGLDSARRTPARAAPTGATQKPARSKSSGRIMSGCSAVSPPSRAQPAWRQPSAMPSTSSAIASGSILPQVITSRKNAGRRAAGDHVVDAHRDQVDAEAVEPAGRPARAAPWCRPRRTRPRSAGRRGSG